MPESVLDAMPIVVAVLGAVLTGFVSFLVSRYSIKVTIREMVSIEYKKTKAELAYAEYVRCKNAFYQELYHNIVSAFGYAKDIKNGPVSFGFDDDSVDIVDAELLMQDRKIPNKSQAKVLNLFRQPKDNRVAFIELETVLVVDYQNQCNESIRVLNNSIVRGYIYMAVELYDRCKSLLKNIENIFNNSNRIGCLNGIKNPKYFSIKESKNNITVEKLMNRNSQILDSVSKSLLDIAKEIKEELDKPLSAIMDDGSSKK